MLYCGVWARRRPDRKEGERLAKYRRRANAGNGILIILLGIVAIAGIILYLAKGGVQKEESGAYSAVILSEVMSSNKGAVPDEYGEFSDWIELYNRSDQDVNISGYGLSDDLLNGAKWTFPAGTVLPPHGYLIVFCGGEAARTGAHASFKIGATDEILLSNVSGTIVDSVSLVPVASGMSLVRDPQALTWREGRPSPGFENTDAGANAYTATLRADASEDVGVYINEFMASNASTIMGPDGSFCDWIELYNTNGQSVDLSGFGISDDSSRPLKYRLPQGTVIDPYGVLLIYCTGRETQSLDRIEAPFGLAAYREEVVFSNRAGKILDSFSYAQMQTDMSAARVPDGTGEFGLSSQPTPGYVNTSAGLRNFLATLSYGTGDVSISEVMNANYSYLKQPDQQYYDWIEIRNNTAGPVSLNGYALSKNAKNPAKWKFPDITLNAGEHLVVMASGKNVTDPQKKNSLATNFRLSGDGEIVFLFDPQGNIADKLQVGALKADTSYGRTGGQLLYYNSPTPGEENRGGLPGYADPPEFVLPAGIYSGTQYLEIRVPDGTSVTYTLDGTEPTEASVPYTGPIALQKTSVVRARAFETGLFGSGVVSASYIIRTGAQTMEDHSGSLPVMSIITDPKNLWDPDTGIYVLGSKYAKATGEDANGITMEGLMNHTGATSANFWQGWERPMHFDLMYADGTLEYGQDAVVRIFGAYSRAKEQKALSIIARPGYGGTMLRHAFFENRPYQEYKSIVLRPSAQDSTNSKIRDIVMTSLLEDGGDYGLPPESRIYVQAYRQMVLYLNGQYWGVYNLREKITSTFIAQHYGLNNPDGVDILMGNGNDKCVIAGDDNVWREYTDMVEWADTHDLSNQSNYAYICPMIDEKNLALYTAAEIIVGNTDTGNIKYWRTKETDNKWRWLFYDFCWAMNRNDNNSDATTSGYRRDFFARYFDEKGHGAGKATSTKLIRALFKNATWRRLLLEYSAYLFNEVYTPEKIIAKVDLCQAAIDSEMVFDTERWSGITYKTWNQHCENIRDYARNYRPYYLKYAQKFFGLSDQEMRAAFGETSSLN